jgi:hypothetical protein
MQSLKLVSSSNSWHELNKKLEELTKSGQAKFAGDVFENVCKYFLQTAPQYQPPQFFSRTQLIFPTFITKEQILGKNS